MAGTGHSAGNGYSAGIRYLGTPEVTPSEHRPAGQLWPRALHTPAGWSSVFEGPELTQVPTW